MTTVASSAGVKPVFSSYVLVHSKLRSRLGIKEGAKKLKKLACAIIY